MVAGPGRARPRVAAVLADALGLPIEAIVDAIYRAPGRLLPGLPRVEADRLAAMLAPLGLDLAVVPAGAVPARAAVRDVAAELLDPDAADAVAMALGQFLGLAPAAALDLLLTPPGIVLGNVTPPTVAALAALLPPGAVRLVEVEPDAARYALFAAGLTRLQAGALRGHLPPGAVLGDDGSALLLGLTRSEADALWRRLRAPDKVRLVPEQLLRFGILLHAAAPTAAATAALERLAGVPAADLPDLLGALPVPVESDLPLAGLEARLADYADAGLTVTAELESFATVVLEVLAASEQALAAAGLSGSAPLATPPLPRPRARLLRHRLEAAGAEVWEAAA
ncbi:hypothetical protein IP88_07205 [alpha proteobacterium AAP81b]|nr:hypothetical protein IP88_07205 [alpha proteobacterium AAP81b]